MKLYLAATHTSLDPMLKERDTYRRAGFIVTSRWIDGLEDQERLDIAAKMDLNDIDASDALIEYTMHGGITGGRHIEFGYAMARNKILILIGPRENVFHYHDSVILCKDTDHAITTLLMLPCF